MNFVAKVMRNGFPFAYPLAVPGANVNLAPADLKSIASTYWRVKQWKFTLNRTVTQPNAPYPDIVWPAEHYEIIVDLTSDGAYSISKPTDLMLYPGQVYFHGTGQTYTSSGGNSAEVGVGAYITPFSFALDGSLFQFYGFNAQIGEHVILPTRTTSVADSVRASSVDLSSPGFVVSMGDYTTVKLPAMPDAILPLYREDSPCIITADVKIEPYSYWP